MLAAFLLAIFLTAIYRSMSHGAVREIDTQKLSMARKILESVRQEMQSQNFGLIKADKVGAWKGTRDNVEAIQKKYKDFKLSVTVTDTSATVMQVKAKCEWVGGKEDDKRSEEITFVLVEP